MRLFAVLALFALATIFLLAAGEARAASSSFDVETISDLYHITADRTLLHSREKVKEAFGHVVVSAEGKRLACDYLWVDDTTKEIKARGNVVFVDKQTTVEAAELHFNMNTGFGSIFYGRVYNDLYSLRGQLIRRVGDGHYLTTEGEYTTCKDCPESWKLAARNVDLTVEGYAFMDGVFIKIKDIPTLYIPYLIVPVKRERQTGLLFPRLGGSSSHGFVFVQPLFLAIDKNQDATIAGGIYSDQGARYEAQYRYKSYHGIEGQTDVFYSRDRKYDFNAHDRGALISRNEFPLHDHFNMRARFFGTLDRDYTYDFPEDINFQNLPAIESNVVAQAPFDDFFLSAEARRYQSLINLDQTRFDHSVVQTTPTVHAGIKERHLLGPLYGNVYGRYDNFVRHDGSFSDINGDGLFDPIYDQNNSNPERIREARRTIVSPEISAPFSVGRYFGFVPSLQYNQIDYHFGLPAPNLASKSDTSVSYLRAKVGVSTSIERVYDVDSDTISKIEHQISPFITASYIPRVNRDRNHPFEQQVDLTGGPFDQFDVVPLTNSTDFERFPQGKSLYYGFDSRMTKKKKRSEDIPRAYPYDLLPAAKAKTYPTPFNRKEEKAIEAEKLWDQFNPRYDLYQEFWTLNVAQAFDFLESRDNPNDPKRAFSYLLAKSSLNLNDNFVNTFEYRYYPFSEIRDATTGQVQSFHDTETFNTSFTWYWKRLQNLRRTHYFQRSISANVSLNGQPNPGQSVGGTLTWSFNDFFTVQGKDDWDIRAHTQTDWAVNAVLTHPSECWGLAFHWDWNRTRSPNAGEVGFQVLLNLDGTGFLGKGAGSTGPATYFGGT